MYKLVRYIDYTLICTIGMISLVFFGIVYSPQGTFSDSYQSVIQIKYDNLIETNEPKIIIVGGSSAGFGINEPLLERETGYKVVNLGLHAGFGGLFNTELAKTNINAGDIVLLGYEYGWHNEEYFENLRVDMVMSAIDHRLDMYRQIPLENYSEVIGYLFTYAEQKRMYPKNAAVVYSRAAFNKKGQMTYNREEYVIKNYKNNINVYGAVNLLGISISQSSIKYLKRFMEFTERQEATVYFIAPPLLEDANACEFSDFQKLKNVEEDNIGIPYISDPVEYIFPKEFMFDTIYHCNNKGERYRTELLYKGLGEDFGKESKLAGQFVVLC